VKILAYVHGYPPAHNAGSEMMLHTMLRQLQQRGHEVQVLTGTGSNTTYQGVSICIDLVQEHALADWCDIIITHLSWTQRALVLAGLHRKPVAHLIHNRSLRQHGIIPRQRAKVLESKGLARRL